MNLRELCALLLKHDVPIETWGTGSAKTVEHLLAEIRCGESILEVDEYGELVRHTRFLDIDVRCTMSKGKVFKLVEDRQVFSDGRIRRRDSGAFLLGAVGEKLRKREKANKTSVRRALREELGILKLKTIRHVETEKFSAEAPSYPELECQFERHHFEVEIESHEFVADGYVERQEDKETFFVWEEERKPLTPIYGTTSVFSRDWDDDGWESG